MTNQGLIARWFVKWYLKRWILNFLTNGGFHSLTPLWATRHIQMPVASSIGFKSFTEFRKAYQTFKQPCKNQMCNSLSIKNRTNTDFYHCWQTLKNLHDLQFWFKKKKLFPAATTAQTDMVLISMTLCNMKVVLVEFYGWVQKSHEALRSGSLLPSRP